MKEADLVKGAIMDVLEGSELFNRIKEDIKSFFERYDVSVWLSLNQAGMIHEIFMIGEEDAITKRLDGYRELQLKRASEKDKWQREVDGKKAIDFFYEMVNELFDKYIRLIKNELEEKNFNLVIDEYHPMIYQSLIKTFDYIFITQLRISKEKGGTECLKG